MNPEEYRLAIKCDSQNKHFSQLMDGLGRNQAKRSLQPRQLGLCGPSSNPDAMALLTQPQQAAKEAAEMGTELLPEMESQVWDEYKRTHKWYVGVRWEPVRERWFLSPAIYAPGSPFISAKSNPMGTTKYAKAFQVHLHLLCGATALAA